MRAGVRAGRGEHGEAERLAREAIAIVERADSLSQQGDSFWDLAEVLAAAGRDGEAAGALKDAVERYERKKNLAMVAQLRPRLEELRKTAPSDRGEAAFHVLQRSGLLVERMATAWRLEKPAGLAVIAAALSLAGSSHSTATATLLSGRATPQHAEASRVDIGRVIETVEHRVARARDGTLTVRDRLYRARFEPDGLALSLRGAPFRLETESIRVGVRAIELAPQSWRPTLNRAERELAPGLIERVTARQGELEWDFVLAKRQRAGSELAIEARVEARGEPRRSKGGLRWPVGRGRSLRMGKLVVRDATGRVLSRVLPEVAGQRLVLHVPARVLRHANYPLTLDPVVSPEYAVSDPVSSPARDDEEAPLLASDGTNYFVVWQKYVLEGGYTDIYGARVTPAGVVLDPGGIAISRATRNQLYPAVAFDGTNYLVAWEDRRNSGEWDLYGARVSTGGAVLDPGGIAISTVPEPQWAPSIAFDGTNYLVVWWDLRSPLNPDIYASRVSPAGAVLDPSGIQITANNDDQVRPSVAFDGTNYLVVWEDDRFTNSTDLYGARVSPGGAVLDPDGIAISTAPDGQYVPNVAFGGTDYLVVWRDHRAGGIYSDVYGARVSTAGSVRDPGGIAISTEPSSQDFPSVASDGTSYFVAWEDGRSGADDIYGTRVSQAGAVLDPAGIAVSTSVDYQTWPTVAFDGANYLVTWQDWRSDRTWDVYGTRVSTAGAVLDPGGLTLSTALNDQFDPILAFDGTNYLIVWEDLRSGSTHDIYGARVSQAGTLLDGAGIAISTSPGDQVEPSVAFDGTNYLVVWHDNGTFGVFGARVSRAGTVLDPGGVPIATAIYDQGAPSVAFDGTNYLVAWHDYRSGGAWDVYITRVSPAGGVLDPAGVPVSTASGNQLFPQVGFDGTNFLVAWHDFRSGAGGDVYGARVSPAGGVLDPAGIPISTAPDNQYYPRVAFDGANYLVVWEDHRSGTYDVYGARVTGVGTVLDPGGIAVSTAPLSQWRPSVAFDGTNYLVAWNDTRLSSDDVFSGRVTPGGAVLDPAGIPLAASADTESSPSLAGGSPGRAAASYVRVAPEVPYRGAYRIFLRFSDEGGPPPPPPPPLPPPPPPPPAAPPRPRPGCHVPRVIGLRLAAARTRIRRKNCALGRVRRVRVRRALRGRVVSQSPRRGSVRRRGFRVNVVLGRR